MFLRSFLLSLTTLGSLFSQEMQSPAQIQKELDSAKTEFEEAKKLFNPWYSGPLLTGSGNTFPPGSVGVQPYLYILDNYAKFNSSGHSSSINDILVINPLLSLVTGITNYLEIALDCSWVYQNQSDASGNGFTDTGLRLGIGLLKETLDLPAIKINIKEIFPSGKYQNLDSNENGMDGTGSGSYKTLIGLAASKVVLFTTDHPMSFRGSLNFSFPAKVSVKGFNNYGGGFGTKGTVSPGKAVTAAFAFEYSFNQNWVFSNDFVYSYRKKNSFSGFAGMTIDGDMATVGGPFSDQLSLAPAIEYNPSQNLNFIAGGWFAVWGRNSLQFAGTIVSVYFSF